MLVDGGLFDVLQEDGGEESQPFRIATRTHSEDLVILGAKNPPQIVVVFQTVGGTLIEMWIYQSAVSWITANNFWQTDKRNFESQQICENMTFFNPGLVQNQRHRNNVTKFYRLGRNNGLIRFGHRLFRKKLGET